MTVQQRQGLMECETSRCLIIHCHGGGFVAQSSASHQVYLRHWANDLDVPIFCIDYSLAPENRFPRQLEEVYYAYCWALKNCHRLGWTGERVLIVGDSAGANLAVAVAMKLAAEHVRKPDGILSIYGCLLLHWIPSPSRILALLDPLLPLGVLSLCLHAYAAGSEQNSSETVEDCSIGTDCGSAPTDTGRDKLQCRNDVVDVADDMKIVCPSGEARDTSHQTSHKSSSLFKSCSMPLMCSQPPALTLIDRKSLDSELRYLSTYAKLRQFASSPLENSKKNGNITKSPYVSPLLASDEMLRQLCPVHLIACHLDPMLDDSVMFARRLRHIHNAVQLEFVADLPHGFLNFVLVSQEAKAASDRCIAALRSLLSLC